MLIDKLRTGSKGKLEIETVRSIGPHYVKALRLWREKFLDCWAETKGSFDIEDKFAASGELEASKRKWEVCVYLFLAFMCGKGQKAFKLSS